MSAPENNENPYQSPHTSPERWSVPTRPLLGRSLSAVEVFVVMTLGIFLVMAVAMSAVSPPPAIAFMVFGVIAVLFGLFFSGLAALSNWIERRRIKESDHDSITAEAD